jgi:FlaA1/EpsC-like NDP-sugar epimerase
MPAFRIGTLAEAIVEEYAPGAGYDPGEVEIEIVGARPGERIHEKLISEDERRQARELDNMYVILPQIDVSAYQEFAHADAESIENAYTSADEAPLSKEEIITKIDKNMSPQEQL